MSKSSYVLQWLDNGKICYKVFLCSLPDIKIKAGMKKTAFRKVSFRLVKGF